MAYNSKPTVPEVLKWMKDLNDWFSVGEKLGVRFSKLQRLEDKYPLKPEKAKEELVEMWLDEDPNPTWEKLADAFEYAEQRALAKKIRETYNCLKKFQPSRSYAQRSREQIKKPADIPAALPATSYPHPPPSPPPSPPPYTMPGKSFECSCNNFILTSVKRKAINNSPTFLPNLSLTRVASPQRLQLEMRLKNESSEMIDRFGGLVNRILRSFKSRSVSVSILIKCLSNFGALPEGHVQIPLLQHRLRQLKRAGTTDEIFLIISDYISFFNRALLEHLIKELGSESDLEELDTFLVHLEMFAKRRVCETPSYMYGYVWLKSEMLVILQTDEKWAPGNSCNINDLRELLQKVCKIMRVLPHALHVCRVDRDLFELQSMELVCRMPPHVVGEVFPLSREQEKELNLAGVVQLHCIEYCLTKTGPKQQVRNTDSEEVATSDFMSMEEADSETTKKKHVTNKQPHKSTKATAPPHPTRQASKKKKRCSQTQDLLVGQLKMCCHYHEQMSRMRTQSCALVTGGDIGYDGDSETSSEDSVVEVPPTTQVRHSQKRLKWRLAHSQF